MAFDAGSVSVRLGVILEDEAKLNARDARVAKMQRRVETEIGAKVNEREWALIDRKLDEAERRTSKREAFKATIGAEYDARTFSRAFSAFERDLKRMDVAADRPTRSVGGLSRGFSGLNGQLTQFATRIPLVKWGALAAGGTLAAGAVTALASALAPLAGLMGALGPLATALAQVKGTLALATGDLKEAVGGLNEELDMESAAFKRLSPEGQKFAVTLQGLKPAFRDIQQAAQRGLFPGLEEGIRKASANLPVFQRLVRGTAEALGDLAARAGRRLGSDEWGADIEKQGLRNEVTIRRLGTAGLNLAEAFRHVTLAAGPLVDRLTKWVVGLTDGIAKSAEAARETGRLQRFFKDAGDTFFQVVRILGDLGAAFRNIGRIARDVFGNDLLRSIERGAEAFRRWTESARGTRELRSIFEGLRRATYAIAEAIGNVVSRYRELRREGESAGSALTTIFADGVVKAMEKIGERIPQIIGAFVRGFLNANAWGKLAIGGWLIAKFGGVAAFAAIGRRLGGFLGLGVAQGAATGVAAGAAGGAAAGGLLGTLRSKLLPAAKRVGLAGVGIALADSLLNEFQRQMGSRSKDAFKALEAQAKPTTLLGLNRDNFAPAKLIGDLGGEGKRIESANKLRDALKGITEQARGISSGRARQLREEIDKLSEASDKAKRGMHEIVRQGERLGRTQRVLGFKLDLPTGKLREFIRGFERLRNHTTSSIRDVNRQVATNMRAIERNLGRDSGQGRAAMRRNFSLAVGDIRSLMRSGVAAADEGARAIRNIMVKWLATFGIKGDAARVFARVYGAEGVSNLERGDTISGRPTTGSGPGPKLQRGGVVGGRTPRIPRVAVEGSGGAVQLGLQSGLDTLREVAQSKLNARARMRTGGLLGSLMPALVSPGEVAIEPTGAAYRIPGPRVAADSVPAMLPAGTAIITDHGQRMMSAGASLAQTIRHQLPHFQKGGTVDRVSRFVRQERHTEGSSRFERLVERFREGGLVERLMGDRGAKAAGIGTSKAPVAVRTLLQRFATGGLVDRASQFVRQGRHTEGSNRVERLTERFREGGLRERAPGSYSATRDAYANGRFRLSPSLGSLLQRFATGGQVARVAKQAGFRGARQRTAVAVAGAESGWNEKARSATSDHGLWQINQPSHPQWFGSGMRSIYNMAHNARAAFSISSKGGDWNPWVTFKSGAYRGWLGRARDAVRQAGPVGEGTGKRVRERLEFGRKKLPSRLAAFRAGAESEPGPLWDADLIGDIVGASSARIRRTVIPARGGGARGDQSGVKGAIRPGGGWAGSKNIALGFAPLARRLGVTIGSQKRQTQSTASGGTSDHWVGKKNAYAVDYGATGDTGTNFAAQAASMIGAKWSGGSWLNQPYRGYRVQMGWMVPDHYDHVHIGAMKLRRGGVVGRAVQRLVGDGGAKTLGIATSAASAAQRTLPTLRKGGLVGRVRQAVSPARLAAGLQGFQRGGEVSRVGGYGPRQWNALRDERRLQRMRYHAPDYPGKSEGWKLMEDGTVIAPRSFARRGIDGVRNRALNVMRQFWGSARSFFPNADAAMPDTGFVRRLRNAAASHTWPSKAHPEGQVKIPNRLARELTTGGHRRLRRGPTDFRVIEALGTVLHEWAHHHQRGLRNRKEVEGGAEEFSHRVLPRVAKRMGLRGYTGQYDSYPAEQRWVTRHHNKNWILRGQFLGRGLTTPEAYARGEKADRKRLGGVVGRGLPAFKRGGLLERALIRLPVERGIASEPRYSQEAKGLGVATDAPRSLPRFRQGGLLHKLAQRLQVTYEPPPQIPVITATGLRHLTFPPEPPKQSVVSRVVQRLQRGGVLPSPRGIVGGEGEAMMGIVTNLASAAQGTLPRLIQRFQRGGRVGGYDVEAWNRLPDVRRMKEARRFATWRRDRWVGNWPGKAEGSIMHEDASIAPPAPKRFSSLAGIGRRGSLVGGGVQYIDRPGSGSTRSTILGTVTRLARVPIGQNVKVKSMQREFANLIDSLDEDTRLLLKTRVDLWRRELRRLRRGRVTRRERPQVRELRRDIMRTTEELRPGAAPSYRRLERIERNIQRRIRRVERGGIENREERVVVRRLRGAQRIVNVEMGRRVQQGVRVAERLGEGLETARTRLSQGLRRAGVDEGSSGGLALSEQVQRRELPVLERMRNILKRQLARATRMGDTAQVRAITDKIKEVGETITETATTIAETVRAKVAVAAQEAVDAAAGFSAGVQALFQGLEIKQKLEGRYEGGGQERADFILTKIIPALQNDLAALTAQRDTALAQGDTATANALNLSLLEKGNEIASAQLQAQEEIAANTETSSALLDQANEKLRIALETVRVQRGAFQVLAGPGDIGQGAPTALQAARQTTSTAGPGPGLGLTLNPQGQLVTSDGAVVNTSQTVINQTVNTLHPGDPKVLTEIARASNAGNGYTGTRTSPRERHVL